MYLPHKHNHMFCVHIFDIFVIPASLPRQRSVTNPALSRSHEVARTWLYCTRNLTKLQCLSSSTVLYCLTIKICRPTLAWDNVATECGSHVGFHNLVSTQLALDRVLRNIVFVLIFESVFQMGICICICIFIFKNTKVNMTCDFTKPFSGTWRLRKGWNINQIAVP